MNAPNSPNPFETVVDYHERTKHHPDRFARSPGYMDWASQPDPFRLYEGAEVVNLDGVPPGEDPCYDALFRNHGVAPAPVNRRTLSQFFQDSLALSAWKEFQDSRWALRVNPSSGNLHPTEGYLVAGPVPDLLDRPGVCHYTPLHHGLEVRAEVPAEAWASTEAVLPPGAFLVGLTSIHWRESWKYGERAFRYCQLDMGHAVGALAVAAAALGWRARLLVAPDADVAGLLGLWNQAGPEAEHPDGLVMILPGKEAVDPAAAFRVPPPLLEALGKTPWLGRPNVLSPQHQDWPVIDAVSSASVLVEAPTEMTYPHAAHRENEDRPLSGRAVIRQRRSAVAMDGRTALPRSDFYRMLERTAPSLNPVPFDALAWTPCVHLALFVHRVQDLRPGLYLLARDASDRDALRAAFRSDFQWTRPEGCPEHLDLVLLHEDDYQEISGAISCRQDIASDGCFSLGMIARFEAELRRRGPWFYRRLFQEAGAVGQILYLEAEACGIRATGIGCFLDDVMHRLLGLEDRTFQSLYHLTVGSPVHDTRIRTEEPYPEAEPGQ